MTRDYGPREPLDPQVRVLFDASLAARPTPRVIDVAQTRRLEGLTVAAFNVGAPTVPREETITIPGPAGKMRALLFAGESAGGDALPVILYLHGGGYCIMSPEIYARAAKILALGARGLVVSLEYRLAPEHPFPAGIDDCVAAFRWLRLHASELGGDPSRIAVAGDSAGGGLSAATTLRLLAEGDAPPEAVALICAWLDLAMASPSSRTYGPDDALIDDEIMEYWRGCYLPDRSRWSDPYASPVHADVSAFPPTCVVVGTIDPLADDGVRFAEKLRAGGRDVELLSYEGMPHIFPILPTLAQGVRALEQVSAFLAQRFATNHT